MFYQKGNLLIMGAEIPNDEDPDRPLIKASYGGENIGGKWQHHTELFYKDIIDGILSGDYDLYANPWNKQRVVILCDGEIIEHRPKEKR